MDKLVAELIELLRQTLATHERLLEITQARLEAMRSFDVEAMNRQLERQEYEMRQMQAFEQQRKGLIGRLKVAMVSRTEPTCSQIAARCPEPYKGQITGLAAAIRDRAEKLERLNRINQSASNTLSKNLSKVMKIVTGVTQHAGVYMANGRRKIMAPLRVLDAVA